MPTKSQRGLRSHSTPKLHIPADEYPWGSLSNDGYSQLMTPVSTVASRREPESDREDTEENGPIEPFTPPHGPWPSYDHCDHYNEPTVKTPPTPGAAPQITGLKPYNGYPQSVFKRWQPSDIRGPLENALNKESPLAFTFRSVDVLESGKFSEPQGGNVLKVDMDQFWLNTEVEVCTQLYSESWI